jgi:cleavage stimulation factor subunit 3
MADLPAELAFLQSLQSNAPVNYESPASDRPVEDAGDEDEEDYDPSNLTYGTGSTSQPADVNALLSPAAIDLSTNPSRTVSAASNVGSAGVRTRQPRTVGGFVIDDDDEDEITFSHPSVEVANGMMSAENGTSHLQGQGRTLSQVHSPTSDVAIHNAAQQKMASPVVSNGAAENLPSVNVNASHPPGASATDGVDPRSSHAVPVPQNAPTPDEHARATSLPKSRLPQDRVGIMEDRIAEDPRGDIEAWLTLIGEHRRRNKLDEARAVYDRFLKVFPSSVSSRDFRISDVI